MSFQEKKHTFQSMTYRAPHDVVLDPFLRYTLYVPTDETPWHSCRRLWCQRISATQISFRLSAGAINRHGLYRLPINMEALLPLGLFPPKAESGWGTRAGAKFFSDLHWILSLSYPMLCSPPLLSQVWELPWSQDSLCLLQPPPLCPLINHSWVFSHLPPALLEGFELAHSSSKKFHVF